MMGRLKISRFARRLLLLVRLVRLVRNITIIPCSNVAKKKHSSHCYTDCAVQHGVLLPVDMVSPATTRSSPELRAARTAGKREKRIALAR